jgi:hypothetical protein
MSPCDPALSLILGDVPKTMTNLTNESQTEYSMEINHYMAKQCQKHLKVPSDVLNPKRKTLDVWDFIFMKM